jgi:hypothetical protein
MSTRTIVTSQPDVACDVCERRLLRGEQPDVFLAAGERLIVCELCAPRAANEGWMREGDGASVALPPLRPRRGRSFLDRLPAALKVPAPFKARHDRGSLEPDRAQAVPARRARRAAGAGAGEQPAGQEHAAEQAGTLADWAAADGLAGDGELQPAADAAPATWIEQGVGAFNASEFPRRVAGVARSLGAPEVSVRSAEHLDSVIIIVIAWELCWYRYEIDLSEPPGEPRQLEQGSELGELPREDRLANALATDNGALVLTAPAG